MVQPLSRRDNVGGGQSCEPRSSGQWYNLYVAGIMSGGDRAVSLGLVDNGTTFMSQG